MGVGSWDGEVEGEWGACCVCVLYVRRFVLQFHLEIVYAFPSSWICKGFEEQEKSLRLMVRAKKMKTGSKALHVIDVIWPFLKVRDHFHPRFKYWLTLLWGYLPSADSLVLVCLYVSHSCMRTRRNN